MNESVVNQTVPSDLLCLRCRYALRGARREAVCPECALPVSVSMARPILANAPALVLTRLQYWAARLAWTAGLLGLLSLVMFAAVFHTKSNIFTAPGRLIVSIHYIVPPAMLAALIAVAATTVRATAALRDAGTCGRSALPLVLAGSMLLVAGWGMSIVEQFLDTPLFGYGIMAACIWAGGAPFCTTWSRAQRAAALAIGGTAMRWLTTLQFVVACTLAAAGGVMVLGPYVGLAYVPFTYPIIVCSQIGIPYLILAIVLLTAVNAAILAAVTRRLLKARRTA